MALKRRAHRKSRGGCAECRRRRIKCNEAKPECAYCQRHDQACVYSSPSANLTQTNFSQHSQPSPHSVSSCQSVTTHRGWAEAGLNIPCSHSTYNALQSRSLFGIRELALLHHWTISTSRSIVNTPQLDHFWQELLPFMGLQNEFVLHSILSIAALHIAYLNPAQREASLCDAAQHHNKALQDFRESIKNANSDNCEALFVNATLTFFYAFITFGKMHNDQNKESSAMARTSRSLGVDWIPLLRGMEAVLQPVYDLIRVGPLKFMLSLGNWEELDPDVQPGPDDDQLLRIREIWKDGENANVYDETLYLLRRCSAWMQQFDSERDTDGKEWGYNREWSAPFTWLFLASESYFVLQRQRQPPALVIFAYFGALLHRLDGYWWMEGCGKSILVAVEECLGPYWTPWIEWPKKVVGTRSSSQ